MASSSAIAAEHLGSGDDEERPWKRFKAWFKENNNGKSPLLKYCENQDMDIFFKKSWIDRSPFQKETEAILAAWTKVSTIYVDEWRGFPEVLGVEKHSAMPMIGFRSTIKKRTSGIVWLDCPPGWGKTSIGQLLASFDDFKMISVEVITNTVTGCSDLPENNIFVDEATDLAVDGNHRAIKALREHASRHVVCCAGVGKQPFFCSVHDGRASYCVKCGLLQCCAAEKCSLGGEHRFVETATQSLEPDERFSDALAATRDEVIRFMALAFSDAEAPTPMMETADLADALMDYLGPSCYLLVKALRIAFSEFKRSELSKEDLPTVFRMMEREMVSPDQPVRTFRHYCSIVQDFPKVQAALKEYFLSSGTDRTVKGDQKTLGIMGESGILNKATRRPWGRLQSFVLHKYTFGRHGADMESFEGLDGLLAAVCKALNWGDVWKSESALHHEDHINKHVSACLQTVLSSKAAVFSPITAQIVVSTRSSPVLVQCDHVIQGCSLGVVCIEVLRCDNNRKEHQERFADSYVKGYNFDCGAILEVRKHWPPRHTTPSHTGGLELPPNVNTYYMHIGKESRHLARDGARSLV